MGDNHQQINTAGSVNAPFAAPGGISFGGSNHGILITSVATTEAPQHIFDITKRRRLPTPVSALGTASAIITLTGFATGAFSAKELIEGSVSNSAATDLGGSAPTLLTGLLAVALIGIGAAGIMFVLFLRRNVLRLPRLWFFRAWAGIREQNRRTYPYSLRLAMDCPSCQTRKLRFRQVPASWVDFYNAKGKHTKRTVTNWQSVAECKRNPQHSLFVDISGNDFDKPQAR